MQKVSKEIQDFLKDNGNSGSIDEIEIADYLKKEDLKIQKCLFVGINKIYGKVELVNATIVDSQIQDSVSIRDSIVKKSFIGASCGVLNYSVVNDSVISHTKLPDSSDTYVSVINNSQISGDVILGGCDFNRAKSRGGSLFAFAHIGEGEFKRSIIIGTPYTENSRKTLVEIGHFGYYGDLLILGLRTADEQNRSFILDSNEFFLATKEALLNCFFEKALGQEITVERGRTNIGAGTAISNYDPIKESKAGAIILLSSIGSNVSLSPYLTILPHSLIASGSVDISRERNVISENSLVIGARSQGVILENYYDENKKQIMNERSVEEMAYLNRYLSFLETFAEVCSFGKNSTKGFESFAWGRSHKIIEKIADDIVNKTIPQYVKLLEKSVESIKEILSKDPSKSGDYEPRLHAHSAVLARANDIVIFANSKFKNIIKDAENSDLEQDFSSDAKDNKIVLTEKQKIIL